LVAPIVSEKATMIAEKTNTVTFSAARRHKKSRLCSLMFKVDVKQCCGEHQGQVQRFGKSMGRRDNIRKAYVTLQPGQELNIGGSLRNGCYQDETHITRHARDGEDFA
jgi:large subunit ribosomal protein L23